MHVDIYKMPTSNGELVILDRFKFAKNDGGRHTFFDKNDVNILLKNNCILYSCSVLSCSKMITALKDGFRFPFDVETCDMKKSELDLWIELNSYKIFREGDGLWVF